MGGGRNLTTSECVRELRMRESIRTYHTNSVRQGGKSKGAQLLRGQRWVPVERSSSLHRRTYKGRPGVETA